MFYKPPHVLPLALSKSLMSFLTTSDLVIFHWADKQFNVAISSSNNRIVRFGITQGHRQQGFLKS
jgi:hypothetical protein